jgi:hypothetical protein
MTELSNRVEAQRKILRVVNSRRWRNEQLFSLTTSAIYRWASRNGLDTSSKLFGLLSSASAQIFVTANHSDDPVAGTYLITQQRVTEIERDVKTEVARLR